MTELRERVLARLSAVQESSDPAPLRAPDAVADAFALLREAAPSPGESIDLDALSDVLWTFWLRHLGDDDPEGRRNVMVVMGTFGFLQPRVPAQFHLPEPLRESFDAADPVHDALFAYLVSSAFGDALNAPDARDAAGSDRLIALERALAWSGTARGLLPEDHDGFVEVMVHALHLEMARFALMAEPEALAEAAGHGRLVCERLAAAGSVAGEGRAEVIALALGTVMDAARMLGDPSLADVERLAAAFPDGALAPQLSEGLDILRELYADPMAWPGQLDLGLGEALADAGALEHDAGRIACGVRRLRAALDRTTSGHQARPAVVAALVRGLRAFAQERGDEEADREARELLAAEGASGPPPGPPGPPGAEDRELQDLAAAWEALMESSDDPVSIDIRKDGPQAVRVAEQIRDLAEREGTPSPFLDVDIEIIRLFAETGEDPGTVSDAWLARYRTALATLPPGTPLRYGYTAVLAATTGARGQALRKTEPDRAAELLAEAGALTEAAAADAPAGFPPLAILRRGRFTAAVPVAVMAVQSDGPEREPDPELTFFTRLDDIREGDPEHLGSAIADLWELAGDIGEGDRSREAPLAAMLGSAVFARTAESGDPGLLEWTVRLLRFAHANSSDLAEGFDQLLASALTMRSAQRFDAEGAREAAALSAWSPGGEVPADIGQAGWLIHTEFHNALQNYLFGHEPAQLERAKNLARQLKELSEEAAAARQERPVWLDAMADNYLSLTETVGPSGSPGSTFTDDLVERCRRTFEACPAGHPMRLSTGMTLIRVLALRALALRETEQRRATALVAEAAHLVDALGEEAPEGWTDMMRPHLGAIAIQVLGGQLPPVSSRTGPPGAGAPRAETPGTGASGAGPSGTEPSGIGPPGIGRPSGIGRPPGAPEVPTNAMEVLMVNLRNRMSGIADDTAWRNPALPAWFRASGSIGAAAGALGSVPPRIESALSHLEDAVEAMASITDRGSDQESAEHGLTAFEGDIRKVVGLLLMALHMREGTAALKARVAALEEIAGAAAENQPLPDALPESLSDRNASLHSLHVLTGPAVDRATELLERGRGLLLARRIEARADLGELRSAHPDLADEVERLTALLATGEGPGSGRGSGSGVPAPESGSGAGAPAGHAERARLAGLRASRELDDLVAHIRTRPGFDGFLRPLSAAQLRDLAADGPIVVLNHGPQMSHALVVTARSVTALRIQATSEEIDDAARRLCEAVDAISAGGATRPSPAALIAAGATLRETLEWTWHTVVQPVLDLVGSSGPVDGEGPWPRVWWVPTGAFNSLPLHAAQCARPGCERGDCGAALDTVISSYVPGFRTLAHARTRAAHRDTAGSGGALLVASSEDELPGVARTAAFAARLLGADAPLVGPAATREAVLAALGGTSWVHFGCHAATDPAEPSGALLHLPSGEPLSVLEICRARPDAARLAFLAACGTARSSEHLSDEAIHITSAFLLAGFPTAVGTLWEIDSRHADEVTKDFYRRLTSDPAASPAHVLHHTVRALRHRIPDRPHIWAAYVHAGT